MLALIQGNDADKGWTSPYILTLFGIGAAMLIIFVVGEMFLKNPMVDPRLFGNLSFSGAAIVAFTLSAGLYSLFFFLTLYLQNYLGFSAMDAGLRFLPLSRLVLVSAPLTGAFTHRLGTKVITVAGMAVLVVSVVVMARLSPGDTQSDWILLLPAFILAGLGSGLVNPMISRATCSRVEQACTGPTREGGFRRRSVQARF